MGRTLRVVAIVAAVLGVATAAALTWRVRRWAAHAPSDPSTNQPTPAAAEPLPDRVTFTRDVAPIVFARCAGCHRPGESGPFPLLTFADVKKRAGQVADVTTNRVMPPWLPEPGHGEFANDRRLTDRQIAMIRKWAQTGAEEGDPAGAPSPPRFADGWQLGEPDLVVRMPATYTLPASGPDVYRNFVLPLPASANLPAGGRFVRAVEFRPGNPQAVHHAFLLVDRTGEARRRDAADGPEVGYAGMSAGEGVAPPDDQFLSWQPGRLPDAGADGFAWRLHKGADLVLQAHLKPSGKPEPVQASVGLYFADRPPTSRPFNLLVRSTEIAIPPDVADYAVEDRYTLPVDVTAYAVLPHAHYRGKELQAWATLPNGSRVWLLRIRQWDFNWQQDYRYARPLPLPRGTTVSMRFTYDNSDHNPRNPHRPPQWARYGPQTSDEMGELWLQVVPRTEEEGRALREHYVRTWATPDAIRLHEGRLRNDPFDATAHVGLARVLAVSGRRAEARGHLWQAVKAAPKDARAHYYLAEVLLADGRRDEADEHFRTAVALDPDDFRSHNALGVRRLEAGDLDAAAAHFEAAVRANPSEVKGRINLGMVAIRRGDAGGAAAWFEQALAIDPDDPIATANLARVRGAAGRSAP